MAVAGLFSGIGGFELAFTEAGFETELLVELDPPANDVLKAHFNHIDIRCDVADLIDLPGNITVLVAGFPCQNLSMAGDKSGIGGSKSAVVKKMFEIIERSNVPTVVIENVYFMLQLDSGRGMRWLMEQFERLKYSWAYRVLNTLGFGLPHRRRRVYIVASKSLDPRTVLFADESLSPDKLQPSLDKPLGFYWTEGKSGIGLALDGIPPLKTGSAIGIPSPPAVLFPDGEVLTPSVGACEQLQGFPVGWTSVRLTNVARSPEWRMLGNAVSVPVARWVAERIKSPGNILDFDQLDFTGCGRWPDAGWNVGRGRVCVSASDRPISVTAPSISQFRDVTWARLSDRALNGFIARAVEGGLKVPSGFLEALRSADRAIPRMRDARREH